MFHKLASALHVCYNFGDCPAPIDQRFLTRGKFPLGDNSGVKGFYKAAISFTGRVWLRCKVSNKKELETAKQRKLISHA